MCATASCLSHFVLSLGVTPGNLSGCTATLCTTLCIALVVESCIKVIWLKTSDQCEYLRSKQKAHKSDTLQRQYTNPHKLSLRHHTDIKLEITCFCLVFSPSHRRFQCHSYLPIHIWVRAWPVSGRRPGARWDASRPRLGGSATERKRKRSKYR